MAIPVNTAANATREYTYDATGNLLAVTEAAKSGKADVGYSYDEDYSNHSKNSAKRG